MDIICDIDGTLADCSHRRHHLEATPKNWDAFNAGAATDPLIGPIAILMRSLSILAHRIILCSGRNESSRVVTVEWLAKHQIRYDVLYMRSDNDFRGDDIVKEELLDRMIKDGYRPEVVFDDRSRVVQMWRRRGLICCQVAEGDF